MTGIAVAAVPDPGVTGAEVTPDPTETLPTPTADPDGRTDHAGARHVRRPDGDRPGRARADRDGDAGAAVARACADGDGRGGGAMDARARGRHLHDPARRRHHRPARAGRRDHRPGPGAPAEPRSAADGVIAAAALEPAASTTEIGILDDAHAVAIPAEAPTDTVETVRFLMLLGEAMIDSSAPVVQVTRTLERVAAINGAPDVEVIALPTALLVSVPGRTTTQTAASSAGWRQLRLHQVQDVLGVADDAESGRVGPVEGAERIETAVAAPPLYDGPTRVLGYVGVSAGLAMILGGGLVDVLVAAVLGAAIACLQVATVRLPAAYQALVVLSCAFVVSGAVFLLSAHGDRRRDARPAGRPAGHVPAGRPAHHRGDRPGHPADDRGVGAPGGGRDAAGAAGARHRRRRRAGGRPGVRGRLRGLPAARLGGAVDRRARLRHGGRVPQLRTAARAAVDPARARRRVRRAGGGRAVLRRGVLRVHRGAAR